MLHCSSNYILLIPSVSGSNSGSGSGIELSGPLSGLVASGLEGLEEENSQSYGIRSVEGEQGIKNMIK